MDIPVTLSPTNYNLLVDMGLKKGIIPCVAIISAITISSISLVFLVGWHGYYDKNQSKRIISSTARAQKSRRIANIWKPTPILHAFFRSKGYEFGNKIISRFQSFSILQYTSKSACFEWDSHSQVMTVRACKSRFLGGYDIFEAWFTWFFFQLSDIFSHF